MGGPRPPYTGLKLCCSPPGMALELPRRGPGAALPSSCSFSLVRLWRLVKCPQMPLSHLPRALLLPSACPLHPLEDRETLQDVETAKWHREGWTHRYQLESWGSRRMNKPPRPPDPQACFRNMRSMEDFVVNRLEWAKMPQRVLAFQWLWCLADSVVQHNLKVLLLSYWRDLGFDLILPQNDLTGATTLGYNPIGVLFLGSVVPQETVACRRFLQESATLPNSAGLSLASESLCLGFF